MTLNKSTEHSAVIDELVFWISEEGTLQIKRDGPYSDPVELNVLQVTAVVEFLERALLAMREY